MKKLILSLLCALTSTTAFADAVIFSGNDVKALKQNLDLNGQVKILSGATDPTSVATSAPIGSLYMNNSTGDIYRKLDSGSSTNWQKVGNAGLSGTIVPNPDWESGTTAWTASGGTYTRTTTAANVGFGVGSGSWDASASSQTLTSTAVTIPAGLYANNMVAQCYFKSTANDYTMQVFDGSNVLGTVAITGVTTYKPIAVNVLGPSSGSLSIRIVSGSDAAALFIDNCYLGASDGFNSGTLSNSEVFAGISVASGGFANSSLNAWQNANSASLASKSYFGTATAPATANDLAFTVPTLAPGTYEVCTNVRIVSEQGQTCYGAITDGTTRFLVTRADSNNSGASYADSTVLGCGLITYSNAQTSKTFTVQSQSIGSTASRCSISTANPDALQQSFISIKSVKNDIEAAYRPNIMPASWTGYHQNNCAWAATSTSFVTPAADASCTFTERVNNNFGSVTSNGNAPGTGSYTPSITFTPTRAGRYLACATSSLASGGAAAYGFARLWDGTNPLATTTSYTNNNMPMTLCGVVNATSTAAVTLTVQIATTSGTANIQSISPSNGLDWSITALDQAFPAPVLVGSVTSNSTGAERVERAKIRNNGTASILAQSGSWISSVSRTAAGLVSINVTSGTFSAAPQCTVSGIISSGSVWNNLETDSTASLIRTRSQNAASANADGDFEIVCMGPR